MRRGLSLWNPSDGECGPFKLLDRLKFPFLEERVIDWRSLHAITGSVCNYRLRGPFLGLLFYDVILIGIQPCPLKVFDDFHKFRFADLDRMAEMARAGRVVFYLTDAARHYEHYDYLLPLFDEFRPIHVVGANARIAKMDGDQLEIDRVSEALTDRPHIREAIGRYARRNHISLEVADATACWTVQELHYAGYVELAAALLAFLDSVPDLALEMITELRVVMVEPMVGIPGISMAVPRMHGIRAVQQRPLVRQHMTSLPDAGAVIARILSFPTPASWDQLRWCEEHIDLAAIRRAFAILDAGTRTLDVREESEALQDQLQEAWERRVRSASRIRKQMLWGTSLTLAVGGAFAGDPVVGILSGVGLTAAQNVWQEKFTSLTARWISPESYHIWDVDRRMGRR